MTCPSLATKVGLVLFRITTQTYNVEQIGVSNLAGMSLLSMQQQQLERCCLPSIFLIQVPNWKKTLD
jgi:hypothetical protein